MNIFAVDKCPIMAARALCDKHVVKMTLESAQLLSGVIRVCSPHGISSELYKSTHLKHPCAIWARTSRQNFLWLLRHAHGLADEYTFRYGKTHASYRVIKKCCPYVAFLKLPEKQTPFALAMPEYLRVPANPVESYREYYRREKIPNVTCIWTKRGRPHWL